jgi:hypothetical protein
MAGMLPHPTDAPPRRAAHHTAVRALRAVLPALFLASSPGTAPAEDAKPAETAFAIVNGTIRSVDREAHAVVIEVDGGTATLALDRNTLVYLPQGLATVAALRPGDEVRAGRNDRNVAYWIQVRRDTGAARAATPGEGTGPPAGAPPAEASPATTPPSGSAAAP